MPFDPNTRLVVEQFDRNCWELKEPLTYHGRDEPFTIEQGFRTDFVTVPFFLTWLVPRYGGYTNAAVLHDWLFEVVGWLALKLWPFTDPGKRLSPPVSPWPRKGYCRQLPSAAAGIPAVGSEPERPPRPADS